MTSLIDDSVTTCYEVRGTLNTVLINSNDKKETYKANYYILDTFFINNHTVIDNRAYLLLLYKRYIQFGCPN